jgi:hypothetical protein
VYPRLFLNAGGSVLLLLGVAGYANAFTEAGSPSFWLDPAENIAHTALGVVALGAILLPGARTFAAQYQRLLAGVIGLLLLFFAAYGATLPPGDSTHPNAFGVANVEHPVDDLMHLVIGLVGVAAALMGSNPEASAV